MSRFCGERNVEPILNAARAWRDRSLLGSSSIFSAEQLWTLANLQELSARFIDVPDETDRTFTEKLRDQLKDGSSSAKQLAAELMWLMSLCPSNISAETKRENVQEIWSWSSAPFPPNTPFIEDEVLAGIGSAGPGFNNHRPKEFTFVIKLLLSFKSLEVERQQLLLSSPWDFAEWLQQIPDAQSRQFRHMLLYLLFPDDFERVFSSGDRKSILEHFAEVPKAKANKMTAVQLDRLLRETRGRLEAEYRTTDLDFYRPPLKAKWQDDAPQSPEKITSDHVRKALVEIDEKGIPPDAQSTTYDLVEAGKRYPPKLVYSLAFKYCTGSELPRSEFSGGQESTAFRVLRRLGFSIVPKDLLRELVLGFLTQADAGNDLRTSSYPEEYRGLQIRVSFGQGVVSRVPWIAFLAPGEKVSEGIYPVLLYYREAKALFLAYGVSETKPPAREWKNLQAETIVEFQRKQFDREPERYGNSYVDTCFQMPDGLDLERLTSRLDAMITSYLKQLGDEDARTQGSAPEVELPFSKDQALTQLFTTAEELEILLSRLELSKNIILQGPPGVGKTFFAQLLAQSFLGRISSERIRNVQFHASYAYEDFVQGYRPDGKGGFERKDGIFLRFCKRAEADLENKYVFIIDEINRANLSKVFGELLMLIESDKRDESFAVDLAYSIGDDKRFYVPDNVHIIGLMNTADRSLALVDYALRRRFEFFDLKPAFDKPQFSAHLLSAGVPEPLIAHIRHCMTELNSAIAADRDLGPGFLIGHSFFCSLPPEEEAEDAYNQVIQYQIMPLLREYWYDGSKAEDWRVKLLNS
ncbi:MrcB family domain-containing protein [Bradyrhizobium sp. PMVTL-01]|uniref:MrcB family domain-containing protein n=1 Tax=Bradyrhizobium sp. PMVTL-01 TaxID=3434999 RepID=UPI003F6E4B84